MTYAVHARRLPGPAKDVASANRTILMAWLFGMLVFLPVKIFQFPSNLELVDLWVVGGLCLSWASFLTSGRVILGRPYLFPFFLILVGSFVSALVAPNPVGATIPILKEIYLFVWFATLATLLVTLDRRSLRTLLLVWIAVATAHGLLIVAQFLVSDIWHLTTSLAGQSTTYTRYRPSGLFISAKAGDANKAAVFQLLGFVPLVLARLPRNRSVLLGIFLLGSILATGSMGVTAALAVGVLTFMAAILVFDRNADFLKKHLVPMLVAVPLLLGAASAVISVNEDYRDHLEGIILGRASESSAGRFDLWRRGMEAMVEHRVFLWGVGPENFREVDPTGSDNQLHNDVLAFTVERGLIGVSGLVLFALVAVSRALGLLRTHATMHRASGLAVAVFLASIAAVGFVSLTHQIFHTRSLWILLAFQEATASRGTAEY